MRILLIFWGSANTPHIEDCEVSPDGNCTKPSAFANISTSMASAIFESFGVDYNVDFGDVPKGVLGFMLTLISTAIIPALVEEFACRGVIFGLLKEHSEGFAVLVSAILFGIIHGNFIQIPFAFMVGLALEVIRLKTGTLWIAILVHFCNNFVSVIFDYFLYSIPQGIQNVVYFIYLLICLLLGVAGIALLAKQPSEIYSLKGNDNNISEKSLLKTALTRPIIIILISIYLLL